MSDNSKPLQDAPLKVPKAGDIFYDYPNDPGGPRPIVMVDENKGAIEAMYEGDSVGWEGPVKLVKAPDLRWGGEVFAWVPSGVEWPKSWIVSRPWPPPPPGSITLQVEDEEGGELSLVAQGGELSEVKERVEVWNGMTEEEIEQSNEDWNNDTSWMIERRRAPLLNWDALTPGQWATGASIGVAMALVAWGFTQVAHLWR